MKIAKLFCLLMSMLAIHNVSAKANLFDSNDGKFLINSCQEAIEIFKNKSEKRLLAAQMTSVSEAMRAGYCIGVLEQYSKSHSCLYGYSGGNNWYQMAEVIANQPYRVNDYSHGISPSRILEKAYCDE